MALATLGKALAACSIAQQNLSEKGIVNASVWSRLDAWRESALMAHKAKAWGVWAYMDANIERAIMRDLFASERGGS